MSLFRSLFASRIFIFGVSFPVSKIGGKERLSRATREIEREIERRGAVFTDVLHRAAILRSLLSSYFSFPATPRTLRAIRRASEVAESEGWKDALKIESFSITPGIHCPSLQRPRPFLQSPFATIFYPSFLLSLSLFLYDAPISVIYLSSPKKKFAHPVLMYMRRLSS